MKGEHGVGTGNTPRYCNETTAKSDEYPYDELTRLYDEAFQREAQIIKLRMKNRDLETQCNKVLNVLLKCFNTLQGEYPTDQWEEDYPEILEAKALLEKHLGDLGLED